MGQVSRRALAGVGVCSLHNSPRTGCPFVVIQSCTYVFAKSVPVLPRNRMRPEDVRPREGGIDLTRLNTGLCTSRNRSCKDSWPNLITEERNQRWQHDFFGCPNPAAAHDLTELFVLWRKG